MDIKDLMNGVEKVSLRYAKEFGLKRDSAWFLMKLQEELGELTQAYMMSEGMARTKGLTLEERQASFRAELADVICHALLLAKHYDVDIEKEIYNKWLYRVEEKND